MSHSVFLIINSNISKWMGKYISKFKVLFCSGFFSRFVYLINYDSRKHNITAVVNRSGNGDRPPPPPPPSLLYENKGHQFMT